MSPLRACVLSAALVLAAGCADRRAEDPPAPAAVVPAPPATSAAAADAFPVPFAPAARRLPGKLVFAHYFPHFPLSYDNRPAEGDYYQRGFLEAGGENGKHRAYGGYLRQRPLPRPPWGDADARVWRWRNLCEEVLIARAAGCDGFAVDILATSGRYRDIFDQLCAAAQAVDPAFRILLMPDMEAEFKASPGKLVPFLAEAGRHPSVMRLEDGRLAVAPFNAQAQSPEWWRDTIAAAGGPERIAFVPLFQAWWKHRDAYRALCWGMGDWGASAWSEESGEGRRGAPAAARALGLPWFSPVRVQDFRARSQLTFEAGCGRMLDASWRTAIDGDAAWAHLITWNDYAEGTEFAPSTATGCAPLLMTAWYARRFTSGAWPAVEDDALVWSTRIQRLADAPLPFRLVGSAVEESEATVFARAPAELVWEFAGSAERVPVPAGVTVVRRPLAEGPVRLRLERAGTAVAQSELPPLERSPWRTDQLYRWGGSYEQRQRAWLEQVRARVAALPPPGR